METTSVLALDEYYQDGLIYCSKCHTPRQKIIEMEGGVYFKPHIMCKCQLEEYKKMQEKQERAERLQEIARMKSAGLQDPNLKEFTFANDRGFNPELEKARIYVEKWEEMKKESIGLLLWGDVGTGKSFFAGCIANALLEQGVPVLMTNFAKILNALTYTESKNSYIDSLDRYDLLIIDDLGVERRSEFANEQVFNVINSRYCSKKPMIITTNLSLTELKNPADLSRSRIYDRILESCIPLKLNGQNIRKIISAEKMEKVKKYFAD